jgi:hypothetical protein
MEARFLNKINKTPDCWLWTGYINDSGYGCFGVKHRNIERSHRVAYELWKGPIPEGYLIRHTCDNRKCVNPDHLIIGTNQDNANDRVERGRSRGGNLQGENHGMAKINEDDVKEIIILSGFGFYQTIFYLSK